VGWNEGLVFNSQQGEESFLFSKVSRPTLRPHPASYPLDIRGYPLGEGMGWRGDQGMELTFQFYLLLKLRICGATLPPPHHMIS
jgi:hypothetical protein